MDGDYEQKNKTHKGKTTGNKAAKKDIIRKKRAGIDLEPNRGNNVKAFQGPSTGSYKAKQFSRSVEKRESALHLPTEDKTLRHIVPEPPLLVAVVGPPGVGKTTLIRSLVKFYSNRNIQHVRGPITVVAGKSRRVTFFECPNKLAAMCDIAKVADLILLMVDGCYGFEMETFEFLNIAQTHGFPKMFGVISHLDQLKTGKALKKRKKFLRHRFWHEVTAGAKVLCLSPMIRGSYRPTDVLNLHRLLVNVEPKIQSWRNTHSCVLIDRFEDITDPDAVAADPKCSRSVAFYGYTRGKPMKEGQLVHIPGLGDYPLTHLSWQEDPCALDTAGQGTSQGHKMRTLSAKHKKLYAPYCDAGGISYDEDAVYIEEDAEKGAIERSGAGLELLRELRRAQPMDAAKAELNLVGGAERIRRPVVFRDEDTMELEMEAPRRPDGDDDDDDSTDAEDDALYSDVDDERSALRQSLDDFGLPKDEDDEDEEGDGGAAVGGAGGDAGELAPRARNDPDSVRVLTVRHDWTDPALLRSLKDLCVTGDWAAGEQEGSGSDKEEEEAGEEDKGYESNDEEFEAEARGEKPIRDKSGKRHHQQGNGSNSDDSGDDDDEEEKSEREEENEEYDPTGVGARLDALAGVGYKAGARPAFSDSFWDLPGAKKGTAKATATAGGKKSTRGGNNNNDGDDDYDILKDDYGDSSNGGDNEGEEGGERSGAARRRDRSGLGGSGGGDEELDNLVNSFLVHDSLARRPAADDASGAHLLTAADGADGEIQFYDPESARGGGGGARAARLRREGEAEEAAESAAVVSGGHLTEEQERRIQKKMEKKRAFDNAYDAGDVGALDGSKNATYSAYYNLTRKVEEKKSKLDEALQEMGSDIDKKIQLVGYFSGLYVRFVITDIPVEFGTFFDPTLPLIAGGVNPGEDEFRIVHARLKRHRWYPRILKAQDPLLLSMGWRRFQTQPIFATEDPNGRHRYLKYTPEHMHCIAAFYAPVAPTNTGFLAIPVSDLRTPHFRITCTGYTIGNDVTTGIVKKLKLTGSPVQIQKTNAFIKGMFTSDIEAAKFVGVKLKSVSGIRGIIKAAPKGKQGLVRATFEDKLFPSDIVFIRAWKPVEPPRYCSVQRNLLDPEWRGMRPMRELRWAYQRPLETNPDSEYQEIKRRHRVVDEDEKITETGKKVLVSRSTRLQLPYDMKEEFIPLDRVSAQRQRLQGALTVAPERRDQQRRALLDTFAERAGVMQKKKDDAKKRARERSAAAAARDEEKYLEGLKKAKKETARRAEFRTQHKSLPPMAGHPSYGDMALSMFSEGLRSPEPLSPRRPPPNPSTGAVSPKIDIPTSLLLYLQSAPHNKILAAFEADCLRRGWEWYTPRGQEFAAEVFLHHPMSKKFPPRSSTLRSVLKQYITRIEQPHITGFIMEQMLNSKDEVNAGALEPIRSELMETYICLRGTDHNTITNKTFYNTYLEQERFALGAAGSQLGSPLTSPQNSAFLSPPLDSRHGSLTPTPPSSELPLSPGGAGQRRTRSPRRVIVTGVGEEPPEYQCRYITDTREFYCPIKVTAGQFSNVGLALWPAASVLVQLLAQELTRRSAVLMPYFFPTGLPPTLTEAEKLHVVELGAGTGLTAVMLHRLRRYLDVVSFFVLTDYQQEILDNMNTNLTNNSVNTVLDLKAAAMGLEGEEKQGKPMHLTTLLDWNETERNEALLASWGADLILAADCIYDTETIPALVETLRLALSETAASMDNFVHFSQTKVLRRKSFADGPRPVDPPPRDSLSPSASVDKLCTPRKPSPPAGGGGRNSSGGGGEGALLIPQVPPRVKTAVVVQTHRQNSTMKRFFDDVTRFATVKTYSVVKAPLSDLLPYLDGSRCAGGQPLVTPLGDWYNSMLRSPGANEDTSRIVCGLCEDRVLESGALLSASAEESPAPSFQKRGPLAANCSSPLDLPPTSPPSSGRFGSGTGSGMLRQHDSAQAMRLPHEGSGPGGGGKGGMLPAILSSSYPSHGLVPSASTSIMSSLDSGSRTLRGRAGTAAAALGPGLLPSSNWTDVEGSGDRGGGGVLTLESLHVIMNKNATAGPTNTLTNSASAFDSTSYRSAALRGEISGGGNASISFDNLSYLNGSVTSNSGGGTGTGVNTTLVGTGIETLLLDDILGPFYCPLTAGIVCVHILQMKKSES